MSKPTTYRMKFVGSDIYHEVYLSADVMAWLKDHLDAHDKNGLHVCIETLIEELEAKP